MDEGPLAPLRWQLLRCLFDATADLPPEAREPFLERVTTDAALRAEVCSLLAADLRNQRARRGSQVSCDARGG